MAWVNNQSTADSIGEMVGVVDAAEAKIDVMPLLIRRPAH
jgi:hypothetical protein